MPLDKTVWQEAVAHFRAYRHVLWEAGHTGQHFYPAATSLGWGVWAVGRV